MQIQRIAAEQTWELRHTVMWPDRDIAFVKLDEDQAGLHYGVYEAEALISVISLFQEGERMQFRKFATRASWQGKGYGTSLLTFVMEEAKQMGVRMIWCNARKDKAEFYRKHGLHEVGNLFAKDGVQYVKMVREL